MLTTDPTQSDGKFRLNSDIINKGTRALTCIWLSQDCLERLFMSSNENSDALLTMPTTAPKESLISENKFSTMDTSERSPENDWAIPPFEVIFSTSEFASLDEEL